MHVCDGGRKGEKGFLELRSKKSLVTKQKTGVEEEIIRPKMGIDIMGQWVKINSAKKEGTCMLHLPGACWRIIISHAFSFISGQAFEDGSSWFQCIMPHIQYEN